MAEEGEAATWPESLPFWTDPRLDTEIPAEPTWVALDQSSTPSPPRSSPQLTERAEWDGGVFLSDVSKFIRQTNVGFSFCYCLPVASAAALAVWAATGGACGTWPHCRCGAATLTLENQVPGLVADRQSEILLLHTLLLIVWYFSPRPLHLWDSTICSDGGSDPSLVLHTMALLLHWPCGYIPQGIVQPLPFRAPHLDHFHQFFIQSCSISICGTWAAVEGSCRKP